MKRCPWNGSFPFENDKRWLDLWHWSPHSCKHTKYDACSIHKNIYIEYSSRRTVVQSKLFQLSQGYLAFFSPSNGWSVSESYKHFSTHFLGNQPLILSPSNSEKEQQKSKIIPLAYFSFSFHHYACWALSKTVKSAKLNSFFQFSQFFFKMEDMT